MSQKRIVAVLPAFNEQRTIAEVVLKVERLVDEVVVVDDGSTDLTAEIAKKLGATVLAHKTNLGKGVALRTGFEYAKRLEPKVVVVLDTDGQHDPADIPRVIRPVLDGEADLVIGVRSMEMGVMPKERIIGNRVLNEVTSRKAGVRIKDTQSGFRAYSYDAIRKLNFSQNGMAVESQTLIDAVGMGLRIAEVPISVTYRGIAAKRNPASHLSEVFDYILTKTIADSPILYLGIPGLIALIAGLIAGFRVLSIFVETHAIAVGTGLISVALLVIGMIMMGTSLILKFLKVKGAE